jgi:hypothetical protein
VEGAALHLGSSEGRQQAAPGNVSSAGSSMVRIPRAMGQRIRALSKCGRAGAVSGSRLLQSDRAAVLQSGSPPLQAILAIQSKPAAYKSAILNIRFPDSGRSKVSAIAALKSSKAWAPPMRRLNSGRAQISAISSRSFRSSAGGGLKK